MLTGIAGLAVLQWTPSLDVTGGDHEEATKTPFP
jgi:hypothetical protein